MATLHHHGLLKAGQEWRQESIIGSRFVGWLEEADDQLIPFIRGNAWITGRATLLFDRDDPYALGLG